MLIDDLIKTPVAWMSRRGAGIVVSSRVRLARNVQDSAFPGWSGESESQDLCERLKQALGTVAALQQPKCFEMDTISEIDRLVLRERNLISPELSEKGSGSALVVADDPRIAIMINEEDHLRLQAVRPGLHLREIWKSIDAIDTELEKQVDFAFSSRLGYLTACPSNVGTGLRASVMMHLSGMKLTGELDAALNGLTRMGFAVRGILGEGTEAYGNMFQVSNQSTLGQSEAAIIEQLEGIVNEVVGHEENARARLLEQRRLYLVDHIARAYALLTHAHLLSSGESLDMLSALRLGVELGLVGQLTVPRLNEIMLITQPGHLQKTAGHTLTPEERDGLRAQVVRAKLKNVALAPVAGSAPRARSGRAGTRTTDKDMTTP